MFAPCVTRLAATFTAGTISLFVSQDFQNGLAHSMGVHGKSVSWLIPRHGGSGRRLASLLTCPAWTFGERTGAAAG